MIIVAVQLVLGIALLYYGAEWMVNGGVAIAKKFRVSPLIIGLTLVAFATSAPELTVSLFAALKGQGDMAVGNVVGSNICNIGLILGLSAVITPMAVSKQMFKVDAPFMLFCSILLAAIGFYFAGFNFISGLVFLVIFAIYLTWNIRHSKVEDSEEEESEEKKPTNLLWSITLVVIGIAALVGGSKLMVEGAVTVGKMCGLSEAVIALTIVAVGTSLPELATSVVAAIKKESDIAIGNVVGSNIFNILLILGVVPVIKPIGIVGVGLIDWIAMVFITILMIPFMRTGYKVSRLEGALLLITYLTYVVVLLQRVAA